MSLASTKEQLVQLLNDPDYKVIALSGKWGTGKSYMWDEIRRTSTNPSVADALYVSLFGLNDLNNIKLRIVQGALPNNGKDSPIWDQARTAITGAKKILTSLHGGFSALDEIALLAVPAILKNKLIVLDDIERKHAHLDIDQVFGFIDEFTKQHGARFVLILNNDQLNNRELWDTLHEKVIDQEIRLNTSVRESFDIAQRLMPSNYADLIYQTVETCELTNIRIIRKIIKSVNRILGGHDGLTKTVLIRVIPSIVLLSAIYYKGIEDGPSIDFVLSHGNLNMENDADNAEEKGRRARWNSLMLQTGIISSDDFELIVVEFLQSGMFDSTAVSAIIDRYIAEEDIGRARNDCGKLFENSFWDHATPEDDLLKEAASIAARSHLLDMYWVTTLHDTIASIPGGEKIAIDSINNWLEAFRKKQVENAEIDNVFGQKLHPLIVAEFEGINDRHQARTSAYDACAHIAKHSGWGPRQAIALKSATVDEFESTIRSRPSSDLKIFMRKMLDFCVHRATYEPHFGPAMDNFTLACRAIANDVTKPRLAALVKHLFKNANLTTEIEAE